MIKGDPVRVRLTSGDQVKMVVWKQLKSSVLVCKPEAFETAKKSKDEPITVEFSDVFVD